MQHCGPLVTPLSVLIVYTAFDSMLYIRHRQQTDILHHNTKWEPTSAIKVMVYLVTTSESEIDFSHALLGKRL